MADSSKYPVTDALQVILTEEGIQFVPCTLRALGILWEFRSSED